MGDHGGSRNGTASEDGGEGGIRGGGGEVLRLGEARIGGVKSKRTTSTPPGAGAARKADRVAVISSRGARGPPRVLKAGERSCLARGEGGRRVAACPVLTCWQWTKARRRRGRLFLIWWETASLWRSGSFRSIIRSRGGWVEHDAEDLWQTQRDCAAQALARAGLTAGDLAAVGHRESARDDGAVGSADGVCGASGDRVAGPAHGGGVRAVAEGRRGAFGGGAHGAAARPVFFGDEAGVVARSRERSAGGSGGGAPGVWHGGHVVVVEVYGRGGACDGRIECVADVIVRPAKGGRGTRSCCGCFGSRRRCCRRSGIRRGCTG